MPKKLAVFVPVHRRGKQPPRAKHRSVYATPQWASVRQAALVRDEYTCRHCGRELHGADCTVDHLVPLAMGGAAYAMDNLAASCRSCNSRRGQAQQHTTQQRGAIGETAGPPS